MRPSGDPDAELRARLDELTRPAANAVVQRRMRRSRRAAWPRAVELLAVVPLIYLAFCLVLRTLGVDFAVPWWVVLAATVAVPIVHLGMAGEAASQEDVSDTAALAMVDDELGLQDRLSAAREYLDEEHPTPFMQAAIDDARTVVERIDGFDPADEPQGSVRLTARSLAWPAVGLAAFFLAGLIEVAPAAGSPSRGGPTDATNTARTDKRATDRDPESRLRGERVARRTPEPQRESTDQNVERGDAGIDSTLIKKSRGDVGRGKSSSAQSTSGRSSGEGESTDQAQPTKGSKTKPKKPKAQKPSKDRPRKKREVTPKTDRDSVASSGQGRGRGSSKSPTASEWTSKDQSVADDEEELEDEDDVDDEDEESDARGGVQPNLRQRKPPVNRDLVLGFGGGPPPPHANGRGGPGLPKKQRGVAQLVLGIPYPDQITGKPNPGRTKVTQERIEPQAQAADPVQAGSRTPRSDGLGRLSNPHLLPWMQDLVRKFQAARKRLQSNVRRQDER